MLGQRYVFGRGTEGAAVALAVKEPDPLAHAEPRDAVTELIDNSGAIAVGYHTRKFQCAIAAGAAADIGGIDPPRLQPDPGLPPPGPRRPRLPQRQRLPRRPRAPIPKRP